MIANKKNVRNDIGEHCDLLVADFYNYVEGQYDKVMLIDIRDVRDEEKPSMDGMRKVMSRCDRAWRSYCRLARLSGESYGLYLKRVRKEWQARSMKEALPHATRQSAGN